MLPAPLQHSDDYAHALTTLGVRFSRHGSVPHICRRIAVLGTLTYAPRAGWAGPPPPGLTVINAANTHEDTQLRSQGFIPLVTPQTLASLDLRPSRDQQRAAMHGKWRNRLSAARRGGLTLQFGPFDPAKHGWLLTQENQQRRQNRYTGLPHRFLLAYPVENTLLVQAQSNGTTVAAMLFLIHAPGATYHIGWYGPEGRRLNAHNLILWQASQSLRARGITALDLGTLDSVNAPGLARFKLGCGAKPLELGHTWLYLPYVSPMIRAIGRTRGFLSGLFCKGSIGGPRTSQDTPHGSAQHRHYRPR